jgi:hypothetical protein
MIEQDLKRIADAVEALVQIMLRNEKHTVSAAVAQAAAAQVAARAAQEEQKPPAKRKSRVNNEGTLSADDVELLPDPVPPRDDIATVVEEVYDMAEQASQEEDTLVREMQLEEDKQYTKEDVRAALVALAGRVGQSNARQLLIDVGKASNLANLDPARYGLVILAANEEGI